MKVGKESRAMFESKSSEHSKGELHEAIVGKWRLRGGPFIGVVCGQEVSVGQRWLLSVVIDHKLIVEVGLKA